jgi:hypothetical protein
VVITPAEILYQAERRGCRFAVVGGRLRATPKVGDDALYGAIGANKDAIVALLREREAACATDAVSAAQRLLRHGRFPATRPEDCGFLCGYPGALCERCGTPWPEHR